MKISFKTKLIIFLEIFLIVSNALLGIFVWRELSYMVREISRNRLMAVASSAAAVIDAEQHEKILTGDDEDNDDYAEVQSVLVKVMEANKDVFDMYTMRKTEEEDIYAYVVGANETKDENDDGIIEQWEERVEVGEEEDMSIFPEIRNAYDVASADRKIACDIWGCFLSGYAPLKNEAGDAVALVGADIWADDIIDFEKKAKIVIALIMGFLTIVLPLALYLFLHLILRPVSVIIKGLEKFRHDLSGRLEINSKDEFGLIASTFNRMASELQSLYRGLEEKVREKTKQLADKIEEIKKEKAKDEALLASIGEGMIATDEKGKVIVINQQAEKILKISATDSIGKHITRLSSLEDEKEKPISFEEQPLSKALSLASRIAFGGYCTRKDGTKLPIFLVCSPVVLNKKIIGTITLFRDISREKEIDKAKSEFVSLASHQLKSPLSNIGWYTEMLLAEDAGKLKKQQKKYLEKVARANHKMVELVNSFLNISRIEMGTFIVEPEIINMKDMASEVLDEFKATIVNKKITVTQNFDSSWNFSADAKLMRIIFQNLLSNAIKYTPLGGKISLDFIEQENEVKIKVSDTGYGIPENQQKDIFTKLFRADNIKEKEAEGSGLGLYIVKSIVEVSGGKIMFESKENRGTTFEIVYPKTGMKEKKGIKKLNL